MSELRDAVARVIKYAPLTVQYADGGYAAQPFVTVLTEEGQAVVDLVGAYRQLKVATLVGDGFTGDTPAKREALEATEAAEARVMELAGGE